MKSLAIALASGLITAGVFFGLVDRADPKVDVTGDKARQSYNQEKSAHAGEQAHDQEAKEKLALAASALGAASRTKGEVASAEDQHRIPVPERLSPLQELLVEPKGGKPSIEARRVRVSIKIEIEEALRDCLGPGPRPKGWIRFTTRVEAPLDGDIEVKDLRLTSVSETIELSPNEKACLATRLTSITHVPDSAAAAAMLGRVMPAWESFQIEWPCPTCG